MRYLLWLAGWTITGLLAVAAFAFGAWGIWTSDERGQVAALLIFAAIVVGFATSFLAFDEVPRPPPPRHIRKRIREEEARIHFDAKVRRMEKEAGL